MKYLKFLLAVLIFIGCSNEPKKQETVLVDTVIPKRAAPPFQVIVEREQRTQARALASDPILETVVTYSPRILNGKTVYDTVVTVKTQTTKSISYTYPEWNSTIKPFKETTTTPVPPPTGASKYLNLPTKRTTELVAVSGQIIENIDFRNTPGNAIRVGFGVTNVEIRNCFFYKTGLEAIEIEGAANVNVHDNLFSNTYCGVYALNSKSVKVVNNEFINVYQFSGGGRGQFVQFNNVTGAGSAVENNRGENFAGESNPEDLVSMFQSHGTATSPISIKGNTFRGGGPSTSGGGIMLGDYGGSYQVAEGNKLLDVGQYGMAIAGGQNCQILNNQIAARQQPFTNNPLYMWAQQGASCGSNTVRGNRVFWIDKNGGFNGGWDAGNCSGSSFEYPARWGSYAEATTAMAIPAHFLKFVNPAEELTIRK